MLSRQERQGSGRLLVRTVAVPDPGDVLERIPYEKNSDDFVFDTQFLVQAVRLGYRLGDIPVPVRYFDEASSINFRRSVVYGLRTLATVGTYWLDRLRVKRSPLFVPKAQVAPPAIQQPAPASNGQAVAAS